MYRHIIFIFIHTMFSNFRKIDIFFSRVCKLVKMYRAGPDINFKKIVDLLGEYYDPIARRASMRVHFFQSTDTHRRSTLTAVRANYILGMYMYLLE